MSLVAPRLSAGDDDFVPGDGSADARRGAGEAVPVAASLRRRSGDGALPLLRRAHADPGALACITPRARREAPSSCGIGDATSRMPSRLPEAGEQYRFHFDMGTCIGCKCCVVACNEQNANPASINWRRVGELEGGFFPSATRAFLSMGCNHCLEPTCLEGCPVDAYTKDPATGIVRHSADACIGCQYCTWNCSYGVPQYNPERGVVGKCDMCHGRLSLGQAPACVSACPEGAIAIELVKTDEWRAAAAAAAAPPSLAAADRPHGATAIAGVPYGDHSVSTTRVTVPDDLPPDTRPRDITHVVPEHPHWSLILMTVLTQLSVGAFVTIWLLQLFGVGSGLGIAAIMSLTVAGLALAGATLHLGRPAYAYRALRMWRRSWLSREVLLFGAFAGVATAYAGALWFDLPGGAAIGALTALLGIAGVTASACIYRVPARPAWNTWYTLVEFNVTAAMLGPLFAAAAAVGETRWLALAAAAMAGTQALVLLLRFFRCIASDALELRGTARLLSTVLAKHVLARGTLLGFGAVVLPLFAGTASVAAAPILLIAALVLAVAGEILGRYLFFVSVVPRHLAAPYLAAASEAA